MTDVYLSNQKLIFDVSKNEKLIDESFYFTYIIFRTLEIKVVNFSHNFGSVSSESITD